MVFSIDSLKEPIGSMKPWIRANTSVPLPANWLICDGSTVADSASPFNGLAVPDLRARFVRAHNSLTNSNFGSDVTYFTGGTIPSGGTDSNNLQHQHAEGSHSHGINNDGISHTHGINNDSHTHGAPTASPSNVNNGSALGQIDTYNHSHGGATQSQTINHSHGGSTNSSNGSGTDFRLGVTENRPVFTELLHIIKIK